MEWSGGSAITLGPGLAYGINKAGQVVGVSSNAMGRAATTSGAAARPSSYQTCRVPLIALPTASTTLGR